MLVSEACGPKFGQRLKIAREAKHHELLDNNSDKLSPSFYFCSELFGSLLDCRLGFELQTAGRDLAGWGGSGRQ